MPSLPRENDEKTRMDSKGALKAVATTKPSNSRRSRAGRGGAGRKTGAKRKRTSVGARGTDAARKKSRVADLTIVKGPDAHPMGCVFEFEDSI